jgi:hypothetical protein
MPNISHFPGGLAILTNNQYRVKLRNHGGETLLQVVGGAKIPDAGIRSRNFRVNKDTSSLLLRVASILI